MTTHNFTSPLRYPGGKGMLANFARLVLIANGLLDGDYVEVYAGGASIAWTLLFEEYVRNVHINDISRPIYAFWKSVLDHTEDLCKLLRDTPVTIEERERQKNIQLNPLNHTLLELGFSTFYLNRTNRSGILSGGVIGGKAQSGKWKLDARFNKADLMARIERIARYSSRVRLYNADAIEFIGNSLPGIQKNSLIYLDPPYYSKGEGLYENYYKPDDHRKIAAAIANIKQSWIVSYDNAPSIRELYLKYRSMQYDLRYSAQVRYAGSEVMFFSSDLTIPEVENPSHINLKTALTPRLLMK
jgi:DNA adenine methylase